jgi:hypothetical protein
MWAVIAFAVMALVGQGLTFLQSRSDPEDMVAGLGGVPSIPGRTPAPQLAGFDVVRSGALTFYQFHHVAVELDLPPMAIPGAEDTPFGAFDFSMRFTGTLMLGALVALWLLFLGGRATARDAGGPGWARPIHGAKVAVPYVVLALGYSFLARISIEGAAPGEGAGPGTATVVPVIPSVILWTLVFGLVAGVAGGISTGPLVSGRGSSWEGRVRGVVAGGWRMSWVAVALSLAGLFIVAALYPEASAAYSRLVREGDFASGASIVLTTILLLPNAATGIAAASMGGSIALELLGSACALISYARFPLGSAEAPPAPPLGGDLCETLPIEFGVAPIGYFLFLLVPILASLLGGTLAARRAGSTTPGEAAAIGALAGVVFAAILMGLMILAGFVGEVDIPFSGLFGGGRIALGPHLLSGTLLALVWGPAGGALGGLIASRRIEPPAGEPTLGES